MKSKFLLLSAFFALYGLYGCKDKQIEPEPAKEYGKVYFILNAIPKKPKVVFSVNEAEMFMQDLVTQFCKELNVPRDNSFFSSKTTIAEEMMRNGYDGLIIKGREMVNYNPPENVIYFENENQLYQYYQNQL